MRSSRTLILNKKTCLYCSHSLLLRRIGTKTIPGLALVYPVSRRFLYSTKWALEEKKPPPSSHWIRPTKEDLLKTANGFFERLKMRFKWVLFRSNRKPNIDDLSAFISWLLVGNVVWIVLGTTTFCSLIIFTINSVMAQESMARMVGNYVTRQTGVQVVFESAIVPRWKNGVISLHNIFISRRPGTAKKKTVKGSQSTAAAAAAAAAAALSEVPEPTSDDGNYTQFDLTVDQVNVTVSFRKWMNGKGFLEDVELKGIRGVVDRTHVRWDPNIDPRSYRYSPTHHNGDFELESFKVTDALVTIHQPGGFRPFDLSIFNCSLSRLRKQWLFYDIISADTVSGSYDNSLFTIHSKQFFDPSQAFGESWSKVNRIRIDGLAIDHLNRNVSSGPFSWITSGNVDITADVMIPPDAEDYTASEVIQDIAERWSTTVARRGQQQQQPSTSTSPTTTTAATTNTTTPVPVTSVERHRQREESLKCVVWDLRIQLNNVRATVPLFTPELSYVNNALIRPIVAYINSRHTCIPIRSRVVKKMSEFDGSWTIYDSGLMDDMSGEVYDAFVNHVMDDEARSRRIRKVSLWSLEMAIQILLISLGTIA